MSNFRNLRVWQAAEELAVEAVKVATRIRGPGTSGLRDQLIRAAISVPANIVEGSAHESPHDFARFLRYSLASASEVEGHAQLGCDLRLIKESHFASLRSKVENVRMMLHGLIKKLQDGD